MLAGVDFRLIKSKELLSHAWFLAQCFDFKTLYQCMVCITQSNYYV